MPKPETEIVLFNGEQKNKIPMFSPITKLIFFP